MHTCPNAQNPRGAVPSGATAMEQGTSSLITNPTLQKVLKDQDQFDLLYRDLTSKALKGFDSARRYRMMRLLKADLAFHSFSKKNYSEACLLWESIVNHYKSEGWSHLAANILQLLIQCYKELQDSTNLVRCALDLLAIHKVLPKQEALEAVSILNRVSKSMESALTRDSSLFVKVKVVDLINKVGDDEGSVIQVAFTSLLPAVIS